MPNVGDGQRERANQLRKLVARALHLSEQFLGAPIDAAEHVVPERLLVSGALAVGHDATPSWFRGSCDRAREPLRRPSPYRVLEAMTAGLRQAQHRSHYGTSLMMLIAYKAKSV